MSAEVELLEAIEELAELLERGNRKGSYYYEDVVVKRWVLGSGGRSGNCESCVENADAGWIEEDDVFPADGQFGYVDEPPLHSSCTCGIEWKDTRRRVYV